MLIKDYDGSWLSIPELAEEFEPPAFVGPPEKWEWEIDQFVNGEWEAA